MGAPAPPRARGVGTAVGLRGNIPLIAHPWDAPFVPACCMRDGAGDVECLQAETVGAGHFTDELRARSPRAPACCAAARRWHGEQAGPLLCSDAMLRLGVPILSASVIPGCHADLVVPSIADVRHPTVGSLESYPVPWPSLPPLHDRRPVLFWRGTASGGQSRVPVGVGDRRVVRHARLRFVRALRDRAPPPPAVHDALLTSTAWMGACGCGIAWPMRSANCTDPLSPATVAFCDAGGLTIPRPPGAGRRLLDRCEHKVRALCRHASYIPPERWLASKYLADVGGNTWTGRTAMLLRAGAVVMYYSAYIKWLDVALEPWRNYVPLHPSFADTADRVAWLERNPAAAERIAVRGAELEADLLEGSERQGAPSPAAVCYVKALLLLLDRCGFRVHGAPRRAPWPTRCDMRWGA